MSNIRLYIFLASIKNITPIWAIQENSQFFIHLASHFLQLSFAIFLPHFDFNSKISN